VSNRRGLGPFGAQVDRTEFMFCATPATSGPQAAGVIDQTVYRTPGSDSGVKLAMAALPSRALSPQHLMVPSRSRAHEKLPPAVTAATWPSTGTGTGVRLSVVPRRSSTRHPPLRQASPMQPGSVRPLGTLVPAGMTARWSATGVSVSCTGLSCSQDTRAQPCFAASVVTGSWEARHSDMFPCWRARPWNVVGASVPECFRVWWFA
jgi:hypothetical protein